MSLGLKTQQLSWKGVGRGWERGPANRNKTVVMNHPFINPGVSGGAQWTHHGLKPTQKDPDSNPSSIHCV